MNITLLLGLVLMASALVSTEAADQDQALSRRVDSMIKNSDAVDTAALRDESNKNLLEALRSKAKSPTQIEARALLLRSGDIATIDACLKDFREAGSSDQSLAARAFLLCNNPALIVTLEGDLNRNESVESKKIQAGEEVFRITPVSVLATKVICEIAIHSSGFSPDLRSWAHQLPTNSRKIEDREFSRAQTRKWLTQNGDLLRAGRYSDVRPPN